MGNRLGRGPTLADSASVSSPTPPVSRRARFTSEGTHREAFAARDWGLVLLPGLVWGASFIFIAQGVEHFAPGVVTFARIALGAVTLALFPVARRTRIAPEDRPRLVAVSVLWLAFPMTLFPIAQQHISSGLAGMLNGSIPLFAAVVGSVALARLPGVAQRAGLAVGTVGIVLLGLPALSDGGSSALGVVLVLTACVSYGFAVTVNVPLAQRYGSIPVFWRCQLIATALTAPLGLAGLRSSSWDTGAALAVGALGVFGTAIAFVAMIELSARVGSTRAASLTFLEAVMALILGVLVRHERIVALEVGGCAVLLAGAWLISRADR